MGFPGLIHYILSITQLIRYIATPNIASHSRATLIKDNSYKWDPLHKQFLSSKDLLKARIFISNIPLLSQEFYYLGRQGTSSRIFPAGRNLYSKSIRQSTQPWKPANVEALCVDVVTIGTYASTVLIVFCSWRFLLAGMYNKQWRLDPNIFIDENIEDNDKPGSIGKDERLARTKLF